MYDSQLERGKIAALLQQAIPCLGPGPAADQPICLPCCHMARRLKLLCLPEPLRLQVALHPAHAALPCNQVSPPACANKPAHPDPPVASLAATSSGSHCWCGTADNQVIQHPPLSLSFLTLSRSSTSPTRASALRRPQLATTWECPLSCAPDPKSAALRLPD
jgi:hypothetical protein